jgi:endonuclease-3
MGMMSPSPASRKAVRVLTQLSEHQGKTMLARIGRGRPFRTLVATILSARVRDQVTETVVPEVMRRWPNAKSLARARPKTVEKVIRKIGLYRIKSRRLVEVAGILVRDHQGRVPDDLDELVKLPGVGRKTAGCVVVYAFGGIALPVDTHVHRISNRLGWVKTKNPKATETALYQVIPKKWWSRVNDLLVNHGKTVCKPQNPQCSHCPVARDCPSRKAGKAGKE